MILKRFGKILGGCLLIIVILTILGVIFGGIIIKKVITGAIQQKTGVQVNINDINKGNLTYTDPKSGQTLSIGGNTIPDTFPKDFPIYPGSAVTTSLSGEQNNEQGNAFWLTLTTKDSEDKVTSFYKDNLETNGWKPQTATGTGTGTNWIVSKNKLTGSVTVTTLNNQTSILIILGKDK